MVGFGITGKVCLALMSVALLVGGAFADNINVNGS